MMMSRRQIAKTKMMGNFITNSTSAKTSVNELRSDDETGRKLTGKDLQIDGINQHD